tara:strand:+ start:2981 stop:3187 length:207 start_codon:yes stop_codon:yes gene_type:complete
MKRLQIMAYNPWQTEEEDVTWGVGYTDDKLYDIIKKARDEYPMHCTTFFFENDMIKTYNPLHRDQNYI